MNEIGTLEIRLFASKDNETWTWVKTFEHQDYSDMLGYDDYHYTGHIEYNGTIGRYYKAYVRIWAGNDGAGDTRYFWQALKKWPYLQHKTCPNRSLLTRARQINPLFCSKQDRGSYSLTAPEQSGAVVIIA